jgi:hypothetical protein
MEILTGCIWDFQEGYTLWNPAGAVIRLEHLGAVGHVILLRVGFRRSQNDQVRQFCAEIALSQSDPQPCRINVGNQRLP